MRVMLLWLAFFSGSCLAATSQPIASSQAVLRNNSASAPTSAAANLCSKNGGTLSTQYNGAHKAYAVCVFEDNRQCELHALQTGLCPVGGIKITGYDNPAQIYCAIQGGKVLAVKNAQCKLPGQKTISALKLYNSK